MSSRGASPHDTGRSWSAASPTSCSGDRRSQPPGGIALHRGDQVVGEERPAATFSAMPSRYASASGEVLSDRSRANPARALSHSTRRSRPVPRPPLARSTCSWSATAAEKSQAPVILRSAAALCAGRWSNCWLAQQVYPTGQHCRPCDAGVGRQGCGAEGVERHGDTLQGHRSVSTSSVAADALMASENQKL